MGIAAIPPNPVMKPVPAAYVVLHVITELMASSTLAALLRY
jgi:hypothetical protein